MCVKTQMIAAIYAIKNDRLTAIKDLLTEAITTRTQYDTVLNRPIRSLLIVSSYAYVA